MDPTTGTVTGIRLRTPGGAKFAVKGGQDGVFLPRDRRPELAADRLLIVEGATDALAAHDLDFATVVGRPSYTGGTRHLVALVKTTKPAAVAMVADADAPGIAGAARLAAALALYCRDVRVVTPPPGHKDLRSWVAAGASRLNLDRLIADAPALDKDWIDAELVKLVAAKNVPAVGADQLLEVDVRQVVRTELFPTTDVSGIKDAGKPILYPSPRTARSS